MNTYYVKACHLWTCASKATNSQVLIRVLREKQEIEFIQCNGGQSHTGKQTDHFSPISNHVLFMRANLVWTMFHWYSTHLLCADYLGTEAILFYTFIYFHAKNLHGMKRNGDRGVTRSNIEPGCRPFNQSRLNKPSTVIEGLRKDRQTMKERIREWFEEVFWVRLAAYNNMKPWKMPHTTTTWLPLFHSHNPSLSLGSWDWCYWPKHYGVVKTILLIWFGDTGSLRAKKKKKGTHPHPLYSVNDNPSAPVPSLLLVITSHPAIALCHSPQH